MTRKVSVIIPTLNRANYISQTINSVLNQSFDNFEIIVVDDGSTDNTSEVIKNYQSKHRDIISYYQQENQGVGRARNFGVSMAKGEYLAFIDSDDLWHPLKLEKQINQLLDLPTYKWIYSDAIAFQHESKEFLYRFSDRVKQYDGDITSFLIKEDFIPSPTPLIHNSLFIEFGGFSDLGFAEDWDLWLRIASKYPVTVIRAPLAYYRIHTQMATNDFDVETQLERRLETIRRAVEFSPSKYERFKLIAESNMFFSSALSHLRRGERQKSREMIGQAIRTNPKKLIYYPYWIMTYLGKRILRVMLNALLKIREFRNARKLRTIRKESKEILILA